MKGFLNGGIFDTEFLKSWQETINCDEIQLRAKLIDLKKYCKEHAKNVGYISLRELESRYGLKNKGSTSTHYKQPYMTSFRIIAYQEEISRHGNVLIPKPTFKVEYSIDIMPDYKEYLEKHHQEHGDYPEDYENTKRCYELYAEEIKTKMPQLPFFKDYFQLLGIINTFCYANVTFEKMGKAPLTDEVTETKMYAVPKAFPPLPVRYFHTYPVNMSLKQLIATETLQKEVDTAALNLFSDRNLRSMAENTTNVFKKEITDFIKMELTKHLNPNEVFESNEEEIERISHNAEGIIYTQIIQTHAAINRALQQMIKVLDEEEQRRIKNLPLLKKIIAIENTLNKHVALYKEKWEIPINLLSHDKVLQAFSPELHELVRGNLQKIKEQGAKELEALIVTCKQQAGIPTPQKQTILPAETSEGLKKEFECIKKQFQDVVSAIEANFSNSTQDALKQQTQLNNAKENLEKNSVLVTQEITRLQQHRADQLAKIPVNARAINAANIAAFVGPLDQEVTRLTTAKAEMENTCKLIVADLTAIKDALTAAPLKKTALIATTKNEIAQDMIEKYQEASLQGEKIASKEEVLRLLDLFHQLNLKKLNNVTKVIAKFSATLLSVKELADIALTQHYTHAIMGFTSQELAQKIGDNHQIVGGCGMAVPNLQTKPLEHGEEFCNALAKAMVEQKNKLTSFSFNGQDYMAYSLAVHDIKQTAIQNPSTQNQAQWAFLKLMKDEIGVETFSADLCQEKLDEGHASMMHYAAATMDAARFNKLPGDPFLVRDKLGNIPLHFAAQSGNDESVAAILSKKPELANAKNKSGINSLIFAIQNNHLHIVKQLISFKADCNYRLPNGLFPLYIALQNNFEEIALYLIDNVPGLNLNETIDSKMTALHLSIEADSLTVALKLIEKGALCAVTRKSDGFTPLFCAVKKGHIALIKAMQVKGVSLQTLLESGKSVLHIAAESGQLECLRYLINQGLNPDSVTSNGDTAIMLAIKAGHLEIATELAKKVKLNQINQHKQTASQLAVKYNMPTVSDILIARGEDPDVVDDKGYNYIYYLVRNGEAQRFFALLDAKKFNLFQTYQGDNILDVAAKFGQFLIVFPLLEQNLLPKSQGLSVIDYAVIADEIGYLRRNAKHISPQLIVLAAKYGSFRCLDWLLKKGGSTKINFPELVKTALEHSNNPKIIEHLMQRLAEVNQVLDAKGNTALHLAATMGARTVIELLLSFGCDLRIRNNDGQSAFHIAVAQEDNWLLKRLLKITPPNEWPADLWQRSTVTTTEAITKTLAIYHKRLPKEAKINTFNSEKKHVNNELPTLIMTDLLLNGLKKLTAFFEDANYEEAVDYLEENPNLLLLFKSQQGAYLIKTLFENIHDHTKLLASLEKEQSEELALELSPDKLLTLLKNKGVNPALFTGENNVILGLLKVKSEKDALYRLKVFSHHFPESVAILAMDNFSNKMRVIELALKLNKVALFKTLIEPCTQINFPTLYGLHEAVLSNNYELVKSLLNKYPIDSLNQKKQTPLMLAASLDNVRIMELLLAHGANPDRVDNQGQNVLHYALRLKAESTALSILPLLKIKNQPDRYDITPLMLAASKGILPVVRYLSEQGDYSESFDKRGWNALHYAAFEGQVESATLLVAQGFDLNGTENPDSPKKIEKNQKRTPLHLAALKGHTEMVRKLFNLGAKMEQEDVNQQSVYEYGIKSKRIDMMHYLKEQEIYSKNRNTQLLLAAAEVDNEEVVSQLILDEVNYNATDESGCTALHLAAIRNSGKVASLILQGGDAAVDITDQRMCTPLYYAAQFGHVWLIKLLCAAGANINYHNNTTPTALFVACEQGNTGAVVALLQFKPDVSLPNKDGLTPMDVAKLHGHHEVCMSLDVAKVGHPKHVANLLIRNGIYRQSFPEPAIAVTNSFIRGQ